MDRTRILVSLSVAILLGSSACADEIIEVPERLRGEPACILIIGSWGHFPDGSMRLIFDEDAEFGTAASCACMTEEEFESGARVDELNDGALEICEQLALQHDFAWTECAEDHASGEWAKYVFWSRGDSEHPSGTALGCVGE